MKNIQNNSKIATAFHTKAAEYDRHILVQKRVVMQLSDSIKKQVSKAPENILDVGTGTGALLLKLRTHYRSATLAGIDIAPNMCRLAAQKLGAGCHIVNGDAEYLPFKTDTFDMVVSASALQWVNDLPSALNEMKRVLKPGGDLKLAFFCSGTLGELHDCFSEVVGGSSNENGVATSRLHNFRTVDYVTSLVEAMDFERFVISVEDEIDWYSDLNSLLCSIKNIGAGTVSGGVTSGLGWRGILRRTSEIYQKRYGIDEKIPATYKVLYLSANTRS